METKQCSSCKISRPLTEYAKNARASNGLCSKCKVCQKAYNDAHKEQKRLAGIAYRSANSEAIKQRKRAYVLANPEWKRQSNAKWLANNRELYNERARIRRANSDESARYQREWRIANPERSKSHGKKWRTFNKDKVNNKTATYRLKKHRASVLWADKSKIEDFYKTADALGMWTGIWHHVDHVIPLNGKTVSGLHVESNLQILTQTENIRKNANWCKTIPLEWMWLPA